MPEMTMSFEVRKTNELTGILPGSQITFELFVLPDAAWVQNIRILSCPKERAEDSALGVNDEPALNPGDAWPDEELLAEDGRRIRFSDFRGKALAFTFFFSRCPLPGFCPRMNKNFAAAGRLLSSASGSQYDYTLLSISFDPEFDTSGQLTRYADNYRDGNAKQWLFAVASTNVLQRMAPRVGLTMKRQGGSISHNLRTVVLDAQGRIFKLFDGNEWTAPELVVAMQEAARLEAAPVPLQQRDQRKALSINESFQATPIDSK